VGIRPGRILVPILAFTGSAVTLAAQVPPPAHFVTWQPAAPAPAMLVDRADSTHPSANGSGMALGGITGLAVGFVTGGSIGSALYDTGSSESDDQLAAAIIGGYLLASLTIPAGVHLGNHSRGNLAADVLVSALVGAVGLGVSAATDNGTPLLVVPIAQILLSAWMEERTMHPAPSPAPSH
jgi:hypothetical protein